MTCCYLLAAMEANADSGVTGPLKSTEAIILRASYPARRVMRSLIHRIADSSFVYSYREEGICRWKRALVLDLQ